MSLAKSLSELMTSVSARGVKRFPVTFISSLLAVFATGWLILSTAQPAADGVPALLTMALWFFTLASATIEIARAIFALSLRGAALLEAAALLLSGAWYSALGQPRNAYFVAYMFVMFALCFIAFFCIMSHRDRDRIGARFVSSLALACAIGGIIALGLIICLSAVDGLLVRVTYYERIIPLLIIFGFGFVALNIFLALLPKRDSEITVPKVMKTLCFYVAFPLFLALVGVLAAYLVKVLITRDIPSNQINLYVSIASLVFIFFSFVLTGFTHRVIDAFKKYMGGAMLPLIAMQVYVVAIRLKAYGLTPLRWVSVVCIALSVAFVISTFIKQGAYKHYVALLAAACMLALSFGPVSALNMPARDQQGRLRALLERNDMLEGGRIKAQTTLPAKTQEAIASSYRVITGGDAVPAWLPQPDVDAQNSRAFLDFAYSGNKELEEDFTSAFGFSLEQASVSGGGSYIDGGYNWSDVNVEGYAHLYAINEVYDGEPDASSSIATISYGDKRVDLAPYLVKMTMPLDKEQLRIELDGGDVLYIQNVSYGVNEAGEAESFALTGIVLAR